MVDMSDKMKENFEEIKARIDEHSAYVYDSTQCEEGLCDT